MNYFRPLFKCLSLLIIFLSLSVLVAENVFSQMPVPTPVQIPNVPNMTYDPAMVARDDFYIYTKADRSAQVFYPSLDNDQGGAEMGLSSQTYNIGTISLTTCGWGFCGPSTAISYRNVLPDGTPGANYGSDTGYYYIQGWSIWGWRHSNLARITIIARPQDDAENAGKSCPVVGQPVNVTNGNMWLEQTDFVLPGLGEHIEVNRFYNSIIQTSGIFGHGWSTKYDESLQIYGGNLARLNMPDGRAVYFVRETPTSPFMPHTAGAYSFIEQNANGSFTLIFKDGTKHQFSSGGRLLSTTDRNGNQTTLNYDANNNLTGITDASGRTLTINMSGGLVQSISDSLGIVAAYAYYTNTSNLQTVTYQDGSQYKFEYDTTTVAGKTFLKTVKDANDKILETHEYDSQGRATTSEKEGGVEKYIFDYSNWGLSYPNYPYTLVKHKKNASDPNYIETKYFFDKSKSTNFVWKTEGNCNCGSGAEATTYEYDDRLNLKKKREQVSTNVWRETTYTYNYQGDVLTMTDSWGTVTNTYNLYGQILTTTDRMGGVWTKTYDASGNLLTAKDPLDKITTFNYPATSNKGLPDSVTDARQNTTKYKWYASGLLQEIEDPYLKKTIFTYDARSRIKSVTNALSHATQYNYFDDTQRKIEVIHPDSTKTVYEYDNRRLLSKITDERGKFTAYQFDDAYRLQKITDPLGHAKEYGYDLMSNVASFKDALGNITNYKYDDFDRLQEIEYPAAVAGATRLKEKFEYDLVGRIKKRFDTANRLTEYGYDDANRTNTVTNANLETTTLKYNQRFQNVEVKDALNKIYTFTYDPYGRQLTQTRAGGTMTYVYDAVGNLEKRFDYIGRETNYVYDNLNRLKTIKYLSASIPASVVAQSSFDYDDVSRLINATNQAGTVTFAYDSRNRIETTTDVFGRLIEYGYDRTATLNQKRLKLDGALYATYKFDDANRLTDIIAAADNATISFGYDNADRLTSRSYPNGVQTTYTYDGMSRLDRLMSTKPTVILFIRRHYYNAANQISRTVESQMSQQFFGYDNADRLTSVTNYSGVGNESYGFDAAGNRTSSHRSASYSYQLFNQLTATDNAAFSYDANGNLSGKTDSNGNWSYSWDYENRLTTASEQTAASVFSYKYDALGRRINQSSNSSLNGTAYTYDGADVLLDDASGAQTKYINGAGIDNKLRQTANGQTSYFLSDHLGSTVSLVDSTGTVTSSTRYDAFGNATNANFASRYQFTGREYDANIGMHYYRNRWYSPDLGRFVSEDPIGFRGGDVNLYGYVWNNPLAFKDPQGTDGLLVLGGGAIAAGAGGSGGALAGALTAAAPPVAVAAGGAALIYGAYQAGDWLANQPWNPVTNGTLNPLFGVPPSMSPAGIKTETGGFCETAPTGLSPNIFNKPSFLGQPNGPAIPVPDVPATPSSTPGPGWVWKGPDAPGGKRGAWTNPATGESLHPDLSHPLPIGPHWDWRDPNKEDWRIDLGGNLSPK